MRKIISRSMGPTCLGVLMSVVAMPALSSPSAAEADPIFFKTPSGNIGCMVWFAQENELRCDLLELQPSFTKRPADCDLEWGTAFAISANGRRAELICHGDTVLDPGARVLGYGKTIEAGGFSCTSERSGLTCQNARGHGFFLSKAKQTLF